MSVDIQKLKALAADAIGKEPGSPAQFLAWQNMAKLANPAAVLDLIAEIERQSAQFKEWQASHHANYCAVADERDELKAEKEALRKDARRWQCVRNAIPMRSPYAVWREGSHLVLGKDADELVDNFLSHAKEASHD